MDWLYYLLEANMYLLLFYAFYRLALQHQTFYSNNRYYLLISSITSFLIPLLQLGFLKPAPIIDNVLFPPPVILTAEQMAQLRLVQAQESINYSDYLYILYLLVATGFAIKLSFNLFKIIRLWLKANKSSKGRVTLIELEDHSTAFSFFNLLFIHPSLASKATVLKHEMVHIKQKHSFDILFFEILQVICWFNPVIYFIKKDVKLLHEYIADEESTSSDADKHAYAMFLIENSFGTATTPLANQFFNQSILKRRINMLNQKKSVGWSRLRLLLAIPLTGAMLCTSTLAFSKTYGYFDLLPEKSKTETAMQQEVNPVEKNQIKFPPPVVKKNLKKWHTPLYKKDEKTGEPILVDKRYVVVNGKAVANPATFYGVSNAETVNYWNAKTATAKYGAKGKNGAVEIIGKDIKYFDKVTIPALPPAVEPPPPGYKTKRDQVKFPPPVVKNLKTPSPVEPPASYKIKKDQVKFPPPIVKPDVKNSNQEQVKFPPPVVKPDGKKISLKTSGDPIRQSEMLEVEIKADPANIKNKVNDEIKEVTIKADKKAGDATSAKKSVFKTAKDKNNVTAFKETLQKKSSSDKLIKLYNASKFQTLFYPNKINKGEIGC
ncbi:MAG: M56 family metallopeptidase [Pedobacter sp.]|nr:MAG: M56 family metallopeptidase [Pedobacter sp.]